jgi:hypothetical protein
MRQYISYSYILRKPTIQLGEKYCTIFWGFGVPLKLVRLIKMCLNETYGEVRIVKHLSDNFTSQNGLKQGDALSLRLLTFSLECAIKKVQITRLA